MTTALLLFAATFCVVFALGLQSLNVNGGHRLAAALTSFLIGTSQLYLFKVLPGPTDALQVACYLLGGPLGIVCSMVAHPWLMARLLKRPASSAAVPQPAPQPAPPPPLRPPRDVTAADVEHTRLHQLARDLLDPEALGYAVPPEVRNRARQALGMTHRE